MQKNVPPVILLWYHKGIVTHALQQKQDLGWGKAHFESFFSPGGLFLLWIHDPIVLSIQWKL